MPGDLGYDRGSVVTVTGKYLNRALDILADAPAGTGLLVIHSHPGEGVPIWSGDDDRADAELAEFLYGNGFLPADAPFVSLVTTHTNVRGRAIAFDVLAGRPEMRVVERVRTLGRDRFQIESTYDRPRTVADEAVPRAADRSVRVFGKEGQRLLADLHVAVVGAGGVGSIVADHLARWGVGTISCWDPDVVEAININRCGVFTFDDAKTSRKKVEALARALPRSAIAPHFRIRSFPEDVRLLGQQQGLADADLIVMLVDDAKPRHYVNRFAYAHYIPVLDGGNVVRSTAENDAEAETASISGGGIRVSHLTPEGPCLWCAGVLDSIKLGLAYRTSADIAADRARGYVEFLGPEHAPSVMPLNALTAALVEMRLQDLLLGLSGSVDPEHYFDLVGWTLDGLPRTSNAGCRHCRGVAGMADLADLPVVRPTPTL
jgi:hypothetical protein